MKKIELFAFSLALFLSSCGTDPGPWTVVLPSPSPGSQGPKGDNGKDGGSCQIVKEHNKCYIKTPNGSWAYVGYNCEVI